jgi:magnesium chelatase family protein
LNSALEGKALRAVAGLTRDGQALLATAVTRMHLSVRGVSRVLRVSRTIADLAGDAHVSRGHVAEALQYRVRDRALGQEVGSSALSS